jgi:three-Cys-motif partner protein
MHSPAQGCAVQVRSQQREASSKPFCEQLEREEPQAFRSGSARRALEIGRPFDRYLFVERDINRCEDLGTLQTEFADLAERIQIIQGDANTVIQDLCERNWSQHRAVLFLDPYGMQVDWTTIESVARTGAIDMWLLFPLGIGVNRMLPRTGEIPQEWRTKLDAFLGTKDWYDAFYETIPSQNLFGEDEPVRVKRGYAAIGKFFQERLNEVFPVVSPEPAVLMNSQNCPLYLLFFAAANEKGGPVALRIANHLLKKIC